LRTTAIEFLCEVEALQEEAVKKTVALLPIANGATECLSHILDRQNLLCRTSTNRELLNVAAGAVTENKVERNIAYDPFDIFWGNPDEPKHSWLLWYFINPHAEHGCGPFLLQRFLSALAISAAELPVDGNCEVTREDEHIDLLITRAVPDGKYAIIIENKVNGAVDRKEQLQNYYGVVRRKGFEEDQIFVCYLTLRGGNPSSESVGSLKTRPTERTFKEHIVPWLEGVLRDRDKWPVKMSEGMSDNLKHYLALIKWRLNKEKIMQMNHWQTTALRCVPFGVFFPKETRRESEIEFKDF
jgi:hypothetical protein